MNRFLLCLALAGMLVLPVLSHAAPPAKVLIAHIGDVEVVEETILDADGNEIVVYTLTAYYNVIEVSENAVKAHANHSIEVQGFTFADIIPYEGGTKGDHFTVEETVEVPVEVPAE